MNWWRLPQPQPERSPQNHQAQPSVPFRFARFLSHGFGGRISEYPRCANSQRSGKTTSPGRLTVRNVGARGPAGSPAGFTTVSGGFLCTGTWCAIFEKPIYRVDVVISLAPLSGSASWYDLNAGLAAPADRQAGLSVSSSKIGLVRALLFLARPAPAAAPGLPRAVAIVRRLRCRERRPVPPRAACCRWVEQRSLASVDALLCVGRRHRQRRGGFGRADAAPAGGLTRQRRPARRGGREAIVVPGQARARAF